MAEFQGERRYNSNFKTGTDGDMLDESSSGRKSVEG
jgi:hypothetical protein